MQNIKEEKQLAFEKVRHSNRKEIMQLQDTMEQKKFNNKVQFTNMLYTLKDKFLNKEQDFKLQRMKMLLKKV